MNIMNSYLTQNLEHDMYLSKDVKFYEKLDKDRQQGLVVEYTSKLMTADPTGPQIYFTIIDILKDKLKPSRPGEIPKYFERYNGK